MESERGADGEYAQKCGKIYTPITSCEVFVCFFSQRTFQTISFFFFVRDKQTIIHVDRGIGVQSSISSCIYHIYLQDLRGRRVYYNVHTMKSRKIRNNPRTNRIPYIEYKTT